MPDQHPARRKHAGELANNTRIVRGIGEEPEGCEEVEHSIEAPIPSRRQLAHVSLRVVKRRAGSAFTRELQQMLRVIEPIDPVTCLGEKVCVPALSTWSVENARAGGKSNHVEQARDFVPVALEAEDGLILEQVLRVEV
jgi:hypothetical protein